MSDLNYWPSTLKEKKWLKRDEVQKKKKKTIQSYEEEKWETVNSAVSKYPKI